MKEQLKENVLQNLRHATAVAYNYLPAKGEILEEAIDSYFEGVDFDELSEEQWRRAALFFAGFISSCSRSQDDVINDLLELSLKEEE